MAALRKIDTLPARALEFTILAGARSGETLSAVFDEFDIPGRLWVVPPEKMKRGREHRVPLSARAVEILRDLPRLDDRVFPIGDVQMGRLLGSMHSPEVAVVHGFRSSFRDWAHECTSFADQVAEQALAHSIGTAVEKAYRRGDLFEKRRKLMQAWADYCSKPAPSGATVTQIRQVAGA
jgi:integrase